MLAPALLPPVAALRRGFELAPEAALEANVAVVRSRASAEAAGQQLRQGFRVGPLPLMIGYADGSELTEMPTVYRLPHAPDWLLGMANLHGMLVPVFDLTRHFGIERKQVAKPMLLVLAHGNDAAGISIDGLPERLRWDTSHVADAATVPDVLAPVVQRPVLIGETLWFDIDCTALLARLEQALVARH